MKKYILIYSTLDKIEVDVIFFESSFDNPWDALVDYLEDELDEIVRGSSSTLVGDDKAVIDCEEFGYIVYPIA